MLNWGDSGFMVYEFVFLQIVFGDMVCFLFSQFGYNVVSIDGMLFEGVQVFWLRFNQDFDLMLDVLGNYGIKCLLYYVMGMVMLIWVGGVFVVYLFDDLFKCFCEWLDVIIVVYF